MRSNRGKTAILTSSPYKDELESQDKPRKEQFKEKPTRKVKATPKKKVEFIKKPKLTKPSKPRCEESSSSVKKGSGTPLRVLGHLLNGEGAKNLPRCQPMSPQNEDIKGSRLSS
ncbi:hypothetical protein M8J77_019587 [Diaphorina citri]|nr:hypothetical protein M8J77_019587 [Diaphorina citri]